jgi:2-(1,2-epoxy-1,2-dihydrophenyl)acetyl-CoA isomerase
MLNIQNNNRVAYIELQRPHVYNALNKELILALIDAYKKLNEDPMVDIIVLTGSGKGFCSGLDLEWAQQLVESDIESIVETYFNTLIKEIYNSPKLTVTKLNGIAAGAGASLALGCDFIFAMDEAKLSFPFLHLGLQPDTGASFLLVQRIGYHKALEWLVEGKTLSMQEANQYNLIANSFSTIEILDKFLEQFILHCQKLQHGSLIGLKKLLKNALHNDFNQSLLLEAQAQAESVKGGLLNEKIIHFLNKKKS